MKDSCALKTLFVLLAVVTAGSFCCGVTSKVTRHSTAAEFLIGETENTVIDSAGTIKLARKYDQIDCSGLLEDTWAINTIIAKSPTELYLGTSPNGDIIKILNGKAKKIYPLNDNDTNTTDDSVDPNAQDDQVFANKHIYAMALDNSGKLLAAVSGETCQLIRFKKDTPKLIYEDKDIKYIFAIALDQKGNIFLGTGPDGKVVKLDRSGKNPKTIAEISDNNIISLALAKDGSLYAGSDQRGIVYRIDPAGKITVVFDSEQEEITAIVIDPQDNIYVAATSAQAVQSQDDYESFSDDTSSGRPDNDSKPDSETVDQTTLSIANTKESEDSGSKTSRKKQKKGKLPPSAGHIYKINPQGFVTDIFTEMAVFFAMTTENGDLLLGTGNDAQLFSVDPEKEKTSIAYEDKQASQITAVITTGETTFLGTANPAKLIQLFRSFAKEGTYISDRIDATQPAKWGKLQIDADIPHGCEVLLASRSGNIDDPDDPSFSEWTKDQPITSATQLNCPNGRFCQYRLTLKTGNTTRTPLIRETATPYVVPNLPPRVTSVKAKRLDDKKKLYAMKISYKSEDDNSDELVYEIEFRKTGRVNWIKLKDKLTKKTYEWDTRTVEDGRYEVRVTTDDLPSNSMATRETHSRISDPFIVDNSAPEIESIHIKTKSDTATLTLTLTDSYSAIGKLRYTVDSNEDWIATLPDDMIYDTTTEDLTVIAEDLAPGPHVIALEITDDIGNTAYKTFDIEIK